MIDEILERLAAELSKSLVPIYRKPASGRVDHEGSGVLVCWRQDFFVLTAAHVIDALEGGLPIAGFGSEATAVTGPNVRSNKPSSGHRADDDLDFAAFPARFDMNSSGRPSYVTTSALDLEWDIDAEQDLFLILGFPNTKQDMRIRSGELQPYVYPLLATADEPEVDARFGRPVRLALRFRPKDIFVGKQQQTAPSLRGMSGGAVWRLPIGFPGNAPPLLSAIVTDHDRARRQVLATRVQLHLDAIDAAGFSDTPSADV